jgi:hypothetical protein
MFQFKFPIHTHLLSFFLWASVFFIGTGFRAQTAFQGYLHYKGTLIYPDSNKVIRKWNVAIFTNDTVVRVETETGHLGVQVYIRHMRLGKAYLLVEMDSLKYAVQTDLFKRDSLQNFKSSDSLTPISKSKYTFKLKRFKAKKITGVSCRCYKVTFDTGYAFYGYFSKTISNKYLEVYSDIPGLAMKYELITSEGISKYEAIDLKETAVNRNLFGIPSDYKRVSFDDLLKEIYKVKE